MKKVLSIIFVILCLSVKSQDTAKVKLPLTEIYPAEIDGKLYKVYIFNNSGEQVANYKIPVFTRSQLIEFKKEFPAFIISKEVLKSFSRKGK